MFSPILLALVGSLALPGTRLDSQTPAQPTSDTATVRQWREDLAYLARELPRRHKNLFHTMRREQFDSALAALDRKLPTLARHQVIVEIARIVALVGDGHTNVAPTRDPKIGFRSYPVRLYFFKDGLFVRSASREQADLVGAKVVRIGRLTTMQAYEAVRLLIGRDNEMNARYFAPFLLVMPEILHAIGAIDDPENAPVLLEQAGTRTVAVWRPAGPASLMPSETDVSWAPEVGWVDMRGVDGPRTPMWLRGDPKENFHFEYLPESRTAYVQFNKVADGTKETIQAFATRLRAFVDSGAVDRLVLDLRLNRGGDGTLNQPLVLSLIRSPKLEGPGRLFVLIGRSTFSAAQFLVHDLEAYTDAVFVGEPTAGKPNSYGDSRRITLPNSGITVRASIFYWQRTHPLDAPAMEGAGCRRGDDLAGIPGPRGPGDARGPRLSGGAVAGRADAGRLHRGRLQRSAQAAPAVQVRPQACVRRYRAGAERAGLRAAASGQARPRGGRAPAEHGGSSRQLECVRQSGRGVPGLGTAGGGNAELRAGGGARSGERVSRAGAGEAAGGAERHAGWLSRALRRRESPTAAIRVSTMTASDTRVEMCTQWVSVILSPTKMRMIATPGFR